ncbi:MAG: hypothetical protein HKM89_13820 [Gemmatimonadales bacterium]|nr:hypothetical protein [Gemmatimonadales bacterium]
MFELSKWYCDCVSDEGAAFIGYWARLRWGPLVLPYAASLQKAPAEAPRERSSLLPGPAPVMRERVLRWNSKRLGIRGVWNARLPSCGRALLEAPGGAIAWDCHVPSAESCIDLANGTRMSGLGYAEHLTLSIRPWQLPFDELRWGRFLSEDDAVTWIEWSGRQMRRWVFHNGRALGVARISEGLIELPDDHGTLEFADPMVLREGRLLSGALRAMPAASLLLRGGLRHAHETKWLSRGTFTTPTRTSSGWTIHEVVRLRPGGPW